MWQVGASPTACPGAVRSGLGVQTGRADRCPAAGKGSGRGGQDAGLSDSPGEGDPASESHRAEGQREAGLADLQTHEPARVELGAGTDPPRLPDCPGSGVPQLPRAPPRTVRWGSTLRQAQAQSSPGWQCCLQHRPCRGRWITSRDGRLTTHKAPLGSSESEEFASQGLTQPGVWVGSSEPNSAFLLQVAFKEESK